MCMEKHIFLGSNLKVSNSVDLGWEVKICISSNFPGEVDAAGFGIMLRITALVYEVPWKMLETIVISGSKGYTEKTFKQFFSFLSTFSSLFFMIFFLFLSLSVFLCFSLPSTKSPQNIFLLSSQVQRNQYPFIPGL